MAGLDVFVCKQLKIDKKWLKMAEHGWNQAQMTEIAGNGLLWLKKMSKNG